MFHLHCLCTSKYIHSLMTTLYIMFMYFEMFIYWVVYTVMVKMDPHQNSSTCNTMLCIVYLNHNTNPKPPPSTILSIYSVRGTLLVGLFYCDSTYEKCTCMYTFRHYDVSTCIFFKYLLSLNVIVCWLLFTITVLVN